MKATHPGASGMDSGETDPADTAISGDLVRVLQNQSCNRLLVIRRYPANDATLKKLLKRLSPPPDARITDPETWLNQVCAERRYPIGIVWDSPPVLPDERYAQLLARLRDLDCEAVYVRCRTQRYGFRPWSQYLRALGFMPLKNYADKVALFYFDVYDYKHVPDWLNSAFWANPEMWNKARW